jgi:chromosomal replication initiation ATPase DnaA
MENKFDISKPHPDDYEKAMKEVQKLSIRIDNLRDKMELIIRRFDEAMNTKSGDFPYFKNVVCSAVRDVTGISYSDLHKKLRKIEYVEARRIVSVIMHDSGVTTMDIGRFLKRDHSTIINHLRKHQSDMLYARDYRRKYEAVINKIKKDEQRSDKA